MPSGTPTTFATVSPVNMAAIAPAFFSGATSSAATTDPIPKNAPCASAVTMRPRSITSNDGANAETRLPSTNRPMSSMSMVLRPSLVPSAVITGAPATTPRA
nr:hypothetical protein [Catenulispora acidiphila]